MDAARYAEVQRLYESARRRPPAERDAFLEAACDGDGDLRQEVDSLLGALEAQDRSDHALSDAEIERRRRALEALRDGATVAVPAPGDPEQVGEYRILRRVAEGGMGVVYEALQASPRRRVALKLLRPMHATPARLRRFRQEAELLGRLRHPGIAPVFEAGTADFGSGAQPFFAMEFVDGLDLRAHCEQADLDARARLELLAKVGDAVQYAHEQGVIHRDLKPANVLVDAHGQPKVLDFGVARASETSTSFSTIVTETGQLLGTLAYMAPEQLRRTEDAITPAVDVYALGVLGFELLTGRRPHMIDDLPLTQAIAVLGGTDAPRAGALVPALRGDVETILGTALESDPARRYPAPAALAGDIRRYLEHRPIRARPPSRAYRAAKFARRNRALVGGTVATMLTLLVGAIIAVVLARGQLDERRRADARTLEARRNESAAVGALLRGSMASLEAGQPWAARSQHRDVPASARGWAWRLHGRLLPQLFDLDQDAESWRIIDRDRFAGPDSASDAWLVHDAVTGTTRRALAGTGIDDLGWPTDSGLVRGRAGDEAALVDLDAGAVRRRWPALRVGNAVSDDEVTIIRRAAPERAEIVVDGVVVRTLEGLDPETSLWLAWDGRHVLVAGEDELVVETSVGGERVLERPRGRGSGWFFDGGVLLVTEDGLERIDITEDGPVDHGVDLDPHGSTYRRYPKDGRFVAMSFGGSALLLDARTGAPWRESRFLDEDGRLQYSHDYWGTAEVAPDGSRLLVVGQYAPPWIVDLEPRAAEPGFDPRCLELRGHTSWIYHVAVSHDGSLVASAAPQDALVRLWDARTGEMVGSIERRTHPSVTWGAIMAFSADDERLVVTTPFGDERLAVVDRRLADGRTEIEPSTFAGNHLPALDAVIDRLDPAPRTRLSQRAAMVDDTAVALWTPSYVNSAIPPDARSARGVRWRVLFDDAAVPGRSTGLAVHPTEPRAAIVSPEPSPGRPGVGRARAGLLAIVDTATGAVVERRSLEVRPWCAAYSPDGTLLAIGGHDGEVVVLETEFLTERYRWVAHPIGQYRYVYSLAWLPDGERLVTASGDRTLRIWDARRTPVIERERTAWTALRRAMAARTDLEAVYDDLRGDDRAAARIERLRRAAAAPGAPEGEPRAASGG